MQEMNSIVGGCILGGNGGGGGGGGDRRLRYHHHHNQALKCPRCDSLNTKFCYYNNYNLSQPRHFCKGCRRYWTKGGVLRNVPVGGGCRKAKRTKSKASSDATVSAASAMPHPEQQQRRGRVKANSRSSSESSSLTVTNYNVAVTNNNNDDSYAGGAAEAVSAVTTRANSISVSEPEFDGNRYNLGFEPGSLEQGSDCGIFSGIGNFTSLITSSNNETMSFSFDKLLNDGQWQQQQQQVEEQRMLSMVREEITGGLLDQTVQVELSNMASRSENGFGALDWQDNGDETLFDKTYWSQSQWIDQDHPTLFFP